MKTQISVLLEEPIYRKKINNINTLLLIQSTGIVWFCNLALKIVNEYDQEIPQSQTADNPVEMRRKLDKTISIRQIRWR